MYDYKGKLLRTVDGDTVDLMIDLGFDIWHKIRVRLNGINTPESRTRDLREKEIGLRAKEFTKNFLEAEQITVITEKTGKFGRYLARLEVNGKDLAQELINNGLAREYHGEKRGSWFEDQPIGKET
jgi:micrococcal nuclease